MLQLSLSADVTVTAKSSFVNLADVEDPTRSLVGIAQSASQGAITARQLEARPIMRTGEVLETVPGVLISPHTGGLSTAFEPRAKRLVAAQLRRWRAGEPLDNRVERP